MFRTAFAGFSIGLSVIAGVAGAPAAAAAEAVVVTVPADLDAGVREDRPTTSYGTRPVMGVDASPLQHSFVRFTVAGASGREITRVRLRMYQVDASRTGGTVFGVPSGSWTESMTWSTRPEMSSTPLGTFGAVASGNWYELDLPVSVVPGDGSVSLGVTSASSDGADWATRESATPPALLLDLAPVATPAAVLTQVAGPSEGSSNPTYFASNHRLVRTAAGRLLTLHGRHATGVQLAWRDPDAPSWSRSTTGAVSDGLLLSGAGTGDWPASMAVGRGPDGRQFAVAVWSKSNFGSIAPLTIRVLTGLDAPAGPQIGPAVVLTAPPLGVARADVGVETAADGSSRVLLTWAERTSETGYALKAAWLDDPLKPSPALIAPVVLHQDTSASRTATVAITPAGARIAARADGGRLRIYGHDVSAGLDQWWSSALGMAIPSGAHPSAAGLASGEVVVTASRDLTVGAIAVQRFPGPGLAPVTELEATGYANPAIAADSSGRWLVAIRLADGIVVSRVAPPTGPWTSVDAVEIGTEGGGNHAWPSLLGHSGAGDRHLLARGPGSSTSRSSVLASTRTVV